MRKRTRKAQLLPDNWVEFKKAILDRFMDQMERRKDWQRMCSLEYKGDIQTYLAKLEEINSRVGATGEPLREIITAAITPEMHRAICQRHKRLLHDDAELIEAVREAGIIEEELTLSSAQIHRGRRQPIVTQADQKDDKKNRKDGKLKENADCEKGNLKDKNQGM